MAKLDTSWHVGHKNFLNVVDSIPLYTPREIFQKLSELGYHGQAVPRKAISLLAYRHLKRIKRIYLDGVKRDQLPPKSNYLLIGPTGCGKTFLIELLFREILHLPAVIIDITTYSETGYVGQDVCTILTRLIHQANDDPMLAAIGVICLDEFDKISTGQNNAIFSGAGTTKDVTGLGVQRELLKMIEGGDVVVPLEITHSSYAERVILSTQDITFLACGAFSGFQSVARMRGIGERMGFERKIPAKNIEGIAVNLECEDVESTANFQAYGFLPEMISRFTRIVPFNALNEDTLKDILRNNVVQKFIKEFEEEGLNLTIHEEVLDKIVKDNLKKETGARGLNSILTRYIEEAAYSSFASGTSHEVELALSGDNVIVKVNGKTADETGEKG